MPFPQDHDLLPAFENFDGWLSTLPEERKTRIQKRLEFTPPDRLDSAKKRMLSVAFISQRTGRDAGEVSRNLETLYIPAFSKDERGLNLSVLPKDAGEFYQQARSKLIDEKDERETFGEGSMAAFRGDDVIPALQAWQAKNGLERMAKSTAFTKGFLGAREWAGDQLEFASNLLGQIESNIGLTKNNGEKPDKPSLPEAYAQFEESLATLADMKPEDRKKVYAIMSAKAEAAGYDPKGFWSQTLSYIGKGLDRATSTVTASGSDLLAGGSMVGGDAMGGFAPVPADAQERFQQGMEQRGKRSVVYAELANLVAGSVDPFRPTVSWMNDTVEEGLVKGPGAVLPFMAASAALGPYGAGVLFTADFAEQNRRDLVLSGMEEGRARLIGMVAAPFQAATESLSNALQLGRFPAVQKVLASFTKPIGGGAGLITRYVQNSIISGATEFTEEQLQDNFIVPATQELLGALQVDVPEVDWSMYRNRAIESTPELLSVLAPMALVFGGTMTAAQANLSAVAISSQDMLEAAGFSSAQANTIRSETAPEAQIAKARELWGQRAGTAKSIEDAAKSVGERMKQLQTDHMAAQLDMERRGILPRMLRSSEDNWRLTFSDGSTADFHTHQDADAARWQWATDQLGKVHLATREALAQMEKNAAVGREFAVEFKPDAMTAKQAVEEGRATPAQIDRRIAQGEAAGEVSEEETFSNAASIDKATSDYLSSLQILGSSANKFKDGVLRTTIRLYEGAHVLTLVEEKLEGDAKQILASKPGSEWMLRSLRNYEQISGDSILRKVPDSELTQDDLIEAWSSLGQSYLVGKSKKGAAIGKGGARRIFADVLKAGMGGAMNSETQFFNAVWRRAAKLSKLKREGKLGEDLTAELERQLGIDSQAAHEAAVADGVASEIASYSEANPGPNGETFSARKFPLPPGLAEASQKARGESSLILAYQAAQRGSSSAMVPIRSVYEQAKKYQPALTPAQFMEQINALNDSGKILVGLSETMKAVEAAGEFRVGGAGTEMAFAPQETFSVRVTPAQDAEYAKAVADGDMETAQAMVDAAAKAAGYNVGPVYHTTDEQFYVWNTDRELGAHFGTARQANARGGKRTMRTRLKLQNPLRLEDNGQHFYPNAVVPQLQKLGQLKGLFGSQFSGPDGNRVLQNTIRSMGHDGVVYANKGEGDGDSFIAFDSSQIKSADPITRDADGNVIPLSQRFNSERNEITFSLRSGDFSSRMAAAFSPFQRSPELRRLMGKLAHDRVMRLAADKVANFGPGKQFTTTGLQSLLESPGWIENRTDELMEQWLEGLTPAARQAYEAGLQSIEDHPLIKEMRGQGLRIMRRATALKQGLNIVDGKETGDYNGMPNLPASLMAKSGFGALPDKIAQAIHDASPGLMPDGHADTLWDALSSVIRDVEDRNATFQDINTKFKAAKKEAMVKAKAEAPASPAYNAEQRKKMKETIRVLDAILSAVPPEVRPRVGGYARVPELDTDAKTMNFIENRIAKLDVELSKYLKKEYAENIKKVLKKNRSTRGKRGQMEGRTVANVTEQIDYAANFSELSKVEQDKEIAHLESIIADDKSTADQIDAAVSRLGIAELFYDFENQDAGALGTISDWLDDLVSSGRDVKKALDEDRREYLTNLKTSGITSILGVPNASQTDAENVAEKIKGSILRQAIEKVKGFINSVLPTTAQQFEDVFGVGSEVGSEFIPRIWDAANQATDIKRAIEASRREMLAKVFKTKSTIKQVSAMAKLQQSKKSGVFILEGRKTESVTVPLEILQRLADGAISAKDAGLTVAESKAALEQWAESSARTRNATIERETFPGTLKEIEMSEMQALNYWLHWNQEAVRARMESHGWTEESIKQLRAFMSEETVEIGRWMSDTYATAGRALVDPVYRRLYHAPLPYVKNFAPTFYATGGNDSTLAIDQAQNSSGIMASFTKGRRPHNHNVRRVDAMTAFLSHFEHVSHWVSYVELLRDMKAVISSEDVQHAIIAQFGPSAASALTKRVKSIETQGNNQAWSLHEIDGMFARLNQALAFKGLSWRISPVVKQTSAVLNPLLADVPAHAYAIGLSKLFAGKLDVSGMWKSGSIQRRIEGGFSAEARIAMQATGGGPVGAVAIQVMSKGMLPMQWTDAGWNAVGAAIAYDYYRGLAIKAGENAEMAEHTAARAVDGMLATAAQPADLVNRSLIEGSPNPFVKAAWMFASESRKTLAIEYYAGKRLLTGKSKNKAMDVQRVVVAHVVMGAVTQLMSGLLASAFGGDDDEEREWSVEQWAAAILAGPINGLFVVGDGLNYLLRMALGVRAFRNLPGYVQLAADAGTAASHIDDLFDGDSEEMMKEINRLSGSIGFVASGFFGPAAQAADVILGNPLRVLAKALGD